MIIQGSISGRILRWPFSFVLPLILLVVISLVNSNTILAQPGCPSLDAGPDQTMTCNAGCANLSATILNTGATTTYSVGSTPYAPPVGFNAGTPILANVDDIYSGLIGLPFTFCFFGNSYNQLVVGSNGVVSFNAGYAGGGCPWAFTAGVPSGTLPINSIFGAYHDIDPSICGNMRYSIQGSAPCRMFILNFDNICQYSCNGLITRQQIVLYETTNVIEVYIGNKPTCGGWNSGNAMIGIQNAAGSVGYAPPGRNTGSWSASNEGWRFTPNGASNVDINWYDGPTLIGTGQNITVCPPSTTTYTAEAVYNHCSSSSTVTLTDQVTVTNNANFDVTLSPASANVCQGISTTLNAGGATTYSWSPATGLSATTGASVTATPAGTTTYTVTGTTGACFESETITITVSDLALLLNSVTPATCGNNNGTIQVSANGGSPAYSYNIGGGGQPTGTFTGLSPGNYTVTVSDQGVCTAQLSVTVADESNLTASLVSQINVVCDGGSNGSLTVAGAGSTGPYSYSIDGVNFGSSATFSGLTAGNYTITVEDVFTCQTIVNVTITSASTLVLNVDGVTNANCGLNDGGLQLSASGGTPPYTFDIGSGSQASGIFTNLAGGAYTVTLEDNAGCSIVVPVTVSTGTFSASIISQTNVDCSGNNNGTVNVQGAGSTGLWTYSLNGAAAVGSGNFTGLSPGPYTVTVEDNVGCILTVSFTVTEPNPLSVAINTQDNSTCNGDDDASVTVSGWGGVQPYSYDIGGGSQVSGTFSSLSPNNYTVVITDDNSCTFNLPVFITEPFQFVLVQNYSNDATCELNNGEIQVQGWGGTLPISFDIGTGPQAGNPHTYSNLAPGNYVINALDGHGCPSQVTVTVADAPEPLVAIASQTDPVCFGGTGGSVTVIGSSGVPTFSYSIDGVNFQASPTFSGLTAGTYTVTAQDGNNCLVTVDVTLTEPPAIVGLVDALNMPLCNGGSDGSAVVSATGGTPPFTFNIGSGPQASGTFNGLSTGSYTMTITDFNSCQITIPVAIGEPALFTANLDTAISPLCNGDANGLDTIVATGGTSPYAWYDIGNGQQADGAFPGLSAGNYSVLIEDANGCQTTYNFTVTDPPPLVISVDNVTDASCGSAIGEIQVSGSGGIGAYTFDIGSGPQASGTFSSLTAGNYTITIVDSNLCTTSIPVIVADLNGMTAGITSQTNVLCNGASTGSVTVSAGGSTGPYTYAIDGITFGASGTFSGLAAGNYTITAEDANTCQLTVSVIITEPTPVVGNVDAQSNVDCNGNSTGSVIISASGGNGPYTFNIGGGFQASGSFTGLSAGNYTVNILDAGLCPASINITITEPVVLTISQDALTDATCGNANGEVQVSGSGGSTPYTFDIGGSSQASGTFSSLSAGNYTVTVTDDSLCTAQIAITIADLNTLTASITTQTNVDCNGASTGAVTVTASASTGPYSYAIDGVTFGASGTFTGLAAGNYTVTAQDVNTCTFPVNVTITEPTPVVGNLDSQVNADCNGAATGSATISASGGSGPYTFDIGSGSQANGIFSGLSAGNYTVNILDVNLCPTSVAITITEPTLLVGNLDSQINVDCNGNSTGSLIVSASGGSGPYTFDIGSGPQASGTFTGLPVGNYTVSILDVSLCPTPIAVTITEPTVLVISQDAVTDASCGNANGEIQVSASGGSTPYTFDTGGGSQVSGTFSGLIPGNYTLTVTDDSLCTDQISVTVADLNGMTASITTQTNVDCNGNSTGSVTVTASGSTPPYTYAIDGVTFGGSGTFTGLAAGNYTITAQDANTCTFPVSVIITEPTPVVGNLDLQVNVDCNGSSTGSATVSASGGSGPYTFDIGTGPQANGIFTGLSAGNYSVNILDVNLCQTSVAVTITEPPVLVISQDAVTDASCGNANGEIQVSGAGGTLPYTFDIGSGPQASGTFSNLTAGSYNITITDDSLCTDVITVNVADLSGLTASITTQSDADCNGASTGSVTITASGSTPPYLYADDGITFGASGTFTGLAAGNYTITAQDANLCTFPVSVIIGEPTVVVGNLDSQTAADCNGASTGSATFSALGGTPPYTYDIGSGPQANGTFTGLSAGNYTVSILDANLCSASVNVTIAEPVAVVGNLDAQVNVDCNGNATGSTTMSASGGTPPYTYDIGSGPQANGTFTGLSAGNYTVNILDANLCPTSVAITITEPSVLVISQDAVTDASCGSANGEIQVSGSGGTLPYTFDIGTGTQASGTFSNLTAGSYNITITDDSLCTDVITVNVADLSGLTASITTQTDADCNGVSTGSVTVTASGSTPPYTYAIDGVTFGASGTFTGLAAGNYTITAQDANLCTFPVSVIIGEPTVVVGNLDSQTAADCNGASTGSATFSASGGTGPYTFDIGTGSQANGAFAGLSAGNYTVNILDANLCSATVNVSIAEPTAVVGNLDVQVNVDCNGNSTGSATVSASGGTPPYTYDIGSGPQANGTFTGLSTGNYTVNILDANLCPTSVNVTITEPSVLVISQDAVTDASCGSANGEIQVSGSGGTLPYTFDMGSGPQASGTFSNLTAGSYNITITDDSLCTDVITVNVADLSGLTASITTQTDADCNGASTGSVTITASGSTGPYSYAIDGVTFGASGTFAGLAAGNYTITAQDANLCTFPVSVAIGEPTVVVGSLDSQTDADCNGAATGSATFSATGGTPPYTFDIGGGSQVNGMFVGLSAANYTVTILDANLCSATVNVTIAEPTAVVGNLDAQVNVDCNGSSTGSTTMSASGGNGPYTFDIGTGPQASGVFSGLSAGNYTVNILDANLCSTSVAVTITEPPVLVISQDAVTDASCGNANGQIQLSGAGGTLPYTFDIGSGPQASGTFSNLTAGSYNLTITDDSLCTDVVTVNVADLSGLTASITTQSDADCNGASTGSVTITASGSTPPYSYAIDGVTFGASGTFTGLAAGNYTITSQDANLCIFPVSVIIGEPTVVVGSLDAQADADCNGASTGSATFSAAGGTPPYTYDIGSGPLANGTFIGLSAANYTVTILDANLCSATVNVTIAQPTAVMGSLNAQVNVDCNGNSTGLALVSASGGTGPYTFEIGSGSQAIGNFTGLSAGNYTVNILDVNLCPTSVTVTITEPSVLVISQDAVTDASCGSANGEIQVSGSGGTLPYTFDMGSGSQASGTFSNLTAGLYNITITDDSLCTDVITVNVADLSGLTASITSQSDADCNGASTGSVTITASGSTPPYLYADDGITFGASGTFTGLAAGNYTITAQDANSCTFPVSLIIGEPTVVVGSLDAQTDADCNGAATGSATFSALGGTPPYTYDIGSGPQANGMFTGLSAGNYTATILDANLCSAIVNVTIAEPSAVMGNLDAQVNVDCNGNATGSATVTASGGTPTYTYDIGSGPQANGTFTGLSAGNYTVTILDANLCQTSVNVTISEPAMLIISEDFVTGATCGNPNGEIQVSGSGGTLPYTFDIGSGPQASGTFSNLTAGSYNITITDDSLCTDVITVNVADLSGLTASITTQTDADCNGASTGSVTVTASGSTPPYLYAIDGVTFGANGTFTGLAAGNYTITAQDANLCTFPVNVIIAEPTVVMGNLDSQTDADCNGAATGSATFSAAGGTPPYTYDIGSGSQANGTFTGLTAGNYTATILDANLCSATVNVTIAQPSAVMGNLDSQVNVDCNGSSAGSATFSATGGTPPYTFDIGSGPQANGTFTGLSAGNYTVNILDANLCPTSVNVTITEPTILDGSVTAQTDVSCSGQSDASVSVVATDGTPPYTYDIGNGAQANGDFTGLSAGNYSVAILDANNCSFVVPVNIIEPVSLSASISSQIEVSCFGGNDGEVTIAAQNGTSPYTFDIGGGTQPTGIFTGLTEGNYSVTVADANNCSVQVAVVISEPTLLIGNLDAQVNVDCNGNSSGSATVSASGGTGPYTFDIGTGPQATGDFQLLNAVNYTVTIEDANLCQTTVSIDITEPTVLAASLDGQVDVDCNGNSTGSAAVSASGGMGPYTFDIGSGPQPTGDFTGLAAGNYTVNVLDNNGCAEFVTFTITEPTLLQASITTQTDVLCSGTSTGSVSISANGGTAPYSFDIGNGSQPIGDFVNLAVGQYTVTVTDDQNCQVTVIVDILEPNPLVGMIAAQTDVSCFGVFDGEVTISAQGGTPPYTFDIGQGAQPVGTFAGLSAGNYTVSIEDANACTFDVSVTITEPDVLTGLVDSQTDVTCFGGSDATATISAAGGTLPYTYDIGNGPQAVGTFGALGAGNYVIQITDDHQCTVDVPLNIIEPTEVLGNIDDVVDVDCNGAATGEITFSAVGGIGPYTFDIGNGAQNNGTFTGLTAGLYTCVITDANNCFISESATVGQPAPLVGSIVDLHDVLCFGFNDGSVLIEASGGTGAYTFNIGNGEQDFGAFGNLLAGDYATIITDDNGCSDTVDLTITEPDLLELDTLSITDALCAGNPTGGFEVLASGGSSPYLYSIGSGAMPTGVFTDLLGGTYTVLVTDDHTCQVELEVVIDVPLPILVGFFLPSATLCVGQEVELTSNIIGGVPLYSFEWYEVIGADVTMISTDSIPTVSPPETAVYYLEVTDANGCVAQSTDQVLNMYQPLDLTVVSPIGASTTVCEGDVVLITLSGSGGNGNLTYYSMPDHVEILNFPTEFIATSNSILQFQLEDGCTVIPANAEVDVLLFDIPTIDISYVAAGCQPLSVTLEDNTNPPLSDMVWSFGDGTPTQTGTSVEHVFEDDGEFDISVDVVTADGCLTEAVFTEHVEVYPKPVANFGVSADTAFLYEANISFTDQSMPNISAWLWDFYDDELSTIENPTHLFQDTGTYWVQLEVESIFGCLDTVVNPVVIIPEFVFWIPNAFTPDGNEWNEAFSGEGDGIDWSQYEMRIYDRWGEMIYHTTNKNEPWDGTYRGEIVEMGVFIYNIQVAELKGKKHHYEGQFTVLR